MEQGRSVVAHSRFLLRTHPKTIMALESLRLLRIRTSHDVVGLCRIVCYSKKEKLLKIYKQDVRSLARPCFDEGLYHTVRLLL